MPSIDRIDEKGAVIGKHELAAALVQDQVNMGLLHYVVTAELAGRRRGTAAAKSRSEVAGSGAKQWRQKGTGRARQGSIRSPQWRGGGKVHTPMPRDFSLRMPRKMRHAALRSALSVKAAQSEIVVLDIITMPEPKTKDMAAILKALGYEVQDDEVIVRVGIITHSVKHVPYRTVTNITVSRDILDRWFFGLGSLHIQTAGMSGKSGARPIASLTRRTRSSPSSMVLG